MVAVLRLKEKKTVPAAAVIMRMITAVVVVAAVSTGKLYIL